MKRAEYMKLLALRKDADYDVYEVGQDTYFVEHGSRIGIRIAATRPCSTDERERVCGSVDGKRRVCDFCIGDDS